jgi:uncharacterized protein YndB with AHSA1/START domain
MTTTLVIVVILAAIAAYIASRPADFRIERAITINEPPERVFPILNDFRAWKTWSPWEGLDPELKRTHSGAPMGAGAVYEWTGNKKVGAGRMTIQKSEPPTSQGDRASGAAVVQILLEFIRPFKATNITTFTLGREGAEATRVTWAMTGTRNFMMKAMGLFMKMDDFVGKDFEKGLASMKEQVEAR